MSLIERLEAAECGSRELDAELLRVFSPEAMIGSYMEGDDGDIVFHAEPFVPNKWPVPTYTTSLDAALALAERALPTHDWSVGHLPVSDDADFEDHWSFGCLFYAHPHVSSRQDVQGWGATAALAICGAILKAKETK